MADARRTRFGMRSAPSQPPTEAAEPQRNPPARTSQDGEGSSRHSGDQPLAGAGSSPDEDLAQLRQALVDERMRNQGLVRQLEDHRRAVDQVDKLEVKTAGMDAALPPKGEAGTSQAHAARGDATKAEFKKELHLQVRSILKEMRSRRERLPRGNPRRKKEYDRRKVIRVTNRRFKRLLNYRTYFLADRRLEYTRRQVAKASKVSKGLDGPFAGQAPFTGEDPLAVFTFLSTFKRACDAAGVRHGQAITLLGFRLAGAAKRSFASATSTLAARSRYAIRTYGDAVNWLLQRYATPDLLNAAY
ncbi:hypothetical protein MMPV_002209 [Pyropia vietnamensis]